MAHLPLGGLRRRRQPGGAGLHRPGRYTALATGLRLSAVLATGPSDLGEAYHTYGLSSSASEVYLLGDTPASLSGTTLTGQWVRADDGTALGGGFDATQPLGLDLVALPSGWAFAAILRAEHAGGQGARTWVTNVAIP